MSKNNEGKWEEWKSYTRIRTEKEQILFVQLKNCASKNNTEKEKEGEKI